jgi:hypothetical protein
MDDGAAPSVTEQGEVEAETSPADVDAVVGTDGADQPAATGEGAPANDADAEAPRAADDGAAPSVTEQGEVEAEAAPAGADAAGGTDDGAASESAAVREGAPANGADGDGGAGTESVEVESGTARGHDEAGGKATSATARRAKGSRRGRAKPATKSVPAEVDDGGEAVLAAKPVVAEDEETTEPSAGKPPRSGQVFVVSAPVAPEATDVSEAATEVDPGSSGAPPAEDETARRRTTSSGGAAGARRKRRREVKRDPRTRGRGVAGTDGNKTDHAGDGQSRSDGSRETP